LLVISFPQQNIFLLQAFGVATVDLSIGLHDRGV